MMEDDTEFYSMRFNRTYFRPEERPRAAANIILLCFLPIEIIIGLLANIWAVTVVIKRRLWLQHEGYVFLGAILITNALILVLHYVSIWFWCLDDSYAITRKSDFLCKVWNFFFNGYYCTGWLVLALLFDVCLRSRWVKKEGEAQTSNRRPSTRALIVALTLILVTLLLNAWQLVSLELHQFDNDFMITDEYHCGSADDWRAWVLHCTNMAALFIHGLPIVLITPVLFALVACSGCRCTGCNYGADSCEHFPRGTLLSIAGIIYFLQFPASFLQLFARPGLVFVSLTEYSVMAIISCVVILTGGLVFVAVPLVCIVTMPKLREATFKADCCSCGHSGKLEIEAIALREAGQER